MNRLVEIPTNFNPSLTISNNGGTLFTDSGLVVLKLFMEHIHFSTLASQLLHFKDFRKHFKHSNVNILEQLIFQLAAGYSTDSAADYLNKDQVFSVILNHLVASQPTISRFFKQIDEQTIKDFSTLNLALLNRFEPLRNSSELIIDVDSTHFDTYGQQEGTAYNAHYGTTGYHPLVAFDGLTGDFLSAELRPGNVYTSTNVAKFLSPLLSHYHQPTLDKTILVRGDSGFATPEIYELCEQQDANYVIRLKSNRALGKLAEGYIKIDDDMDWTTEETYYYSTTYQAASWTKPRRICIKSVRRPNELIFEHTYIVTTLSDNVNAQTVFSIYQKRGQMENYIKEAKNGFFMGKTDSLGFIENFGRLWISALTYNLVNLMKRFCLEPKNQTMQVNSLRLKLFKFAGKLVKTGRRLYLKMSTSHVYQKIFYRLITKISLLA